MAFAPTSITVPAIGGLRMTLRIASPHGDCHISLYSPRAAKSASVAFACGEVQQIRLADLVPEETPAIWLDRTAFDIPVASWKKLAAWLPQVTRQLIPTGGAAAELRASTARGPGGA